jgi:small subunit ribosomal protein S17e
MFTSVPLTGEGQRNQYMFGGSRSLGSVRTDQVKRTAKELIRRFPDKFSHDFENNKKVVSAFTKGTTVKVRNQIAGYITRSYIEEEPEPSEGIAEETTATEEA